MQEFIITQWNKTAVKKDTVYVNVLTWMFMTNCRVEKGIFSSKNEYDLIFCLKNKLKLCVHMCVCLCMCDVWKATRPCLQWLCIEGGILKNKKWHDKKVPRIIK